jgi:hypothetical protein
MSDLAPFIAAVLKDRVVAETKQENDNLTERLQKSQAVQIVSASGTVYAEGQFKYGCNQSSDSVTLWAIILTKQLASCALSNLNNVQICVGGIRKADFRANSVVDGVVLHRYMDGWRTIGFGFGGTGGLLVKVGPFPSEEVFRSQVREDIEPENMASYLTQELAVNHPELFVTFWVVGFPIGEVKGAIQNLNLDRSKRKRKRVAAAAAIEEENYAEDDTVAESGAGSDAE